MIKKLQLKSNRNEALIGASPRPCLSSSLSLTWQTCSTEWKPDDFTRFPTKTVRTIRRAIHKALPLWSLPSALEAVPSGLGPFEPSAPAAPVAAHVLHALGPAAPEPFEPSGPVLPG